MLMCTHQSRPGLTVDQYRDLEMACSLQIAKASRALVTMRTKAPGTHFVEFAAWRLWIWIHRRNRVRNRIRILAASEN